MYFKVVSRGSYILKNLENERHLSTLEPSLGERPWGNVVVERVDIMSVVNMSTYDRKD